MNTIESILNDIDELLEDSWSLPLSGGRCVVDAEKVRDLIDSIRMNMPAEIKQARAVVADRNQILSLAKGEAEALIRKAEERAKQLLEQESIVRQANAKAMALLNDASTRAQQLVEDAQKQAEQTVNDAEAKATAIRTEASTRSREMKQASYEFAENILRTSQEVVAKSLGNITTTRQALGPGRQPGGPAGGAAGKVSPKKTEYTAPSGGDPGGAFLLQRSGKTVLWSREKRSTFLIKFWCCLWAESPRNWALLGKCGHWGPEWTKTARVRPARTTVLYCNVGIFAL